MINRILFVLFAAVLLNLPLSSRVGAQDDRYQAYTIGVGDRLRISVWQEPSLDREVEVSMDSTIVLPLVGPTRAGGYTPAQLSRILTDRYSLYKRDISQVEVVVLEYNSREIFVSGEVALPGRFTFQEIPDLWSVIMRAGGPTPTAFLREVRILRGEGEERRSISIDLNQYLLGGARAALPRLQPGDTVYVPRSTAEGADVFATDVVSVYGQVVRPGQYLVGGEADLVEALLLAGGVTENADVRHVRLVRHEGNRTVVNEVDLNGYFQRGDARGNPKLKPGDTIEVGGAAGVGAFFRRIQPGLSVLAAATTFFWAVDRLTRE